ncbi:hypothetical protein [Microbulbifer sp. 2205BS26-8]|uniref:hypothetical protein n=1 Tax=Microbulbifer sp. 2205BS26-8 TaxID=3064386 RepID=UPI00273F798C|nr:hypothetical protein [Microbulbifer sp. 2205BS26-8]MDP5211284.1 hypothetical protein [Microbulbifer sp. 2205BS26-8]
MRYLISVFLFYCCTFAHAGDDFIYISLSGELKKIDSQGVYQNPETYIIHDTAGGRYVYAGTMDIVAYDEKRQPYMAKASCFTAELWLSPDVPPSEGAWLPGKSCQVQEISKDFKPPQEGEHVPAIPFDWDKWEAENLHLKEENKTLPPSANQKSSPNLFCNKYAGYAPPLVWSPTSEVGGHQGAASFRFTVDVLGRLTIVEHALRYFSPRRWVTTRWFGESTKQITTGNAVASFYIKHTGDPYGSSVVVEVC